MSLTLGTRLGPYEILSAIGAGGMGEVYRARDTRLDRTVAIKILPETLAGDPQFRERFDREARAVAALNHPHICTIHDVGEERGTAYLVMELIAGETLAARLERGALPLEDALRIAVDVASGLDAAHRAGIVHRDLKPGNIMLTKSGAKLLDFGLAKTGAPVVASAGLSMLPTTPANLTAQGTILGTFQYMAPEQLEGQDADARTDIFAFGAVTYEMLTGRKAFEGKSQASLIGAIMHATPPPIAAVQPLAPASLDRIVVTCLAKDPDDRWQTAGDMGRQLKWIMEVGSPPPFDTQAVVPPRSGWRGALPFVVTALVATAISLATASRLMRADEPSMQPITRFIVASPAGVAPRGAGAGRHLVAFSPQGTHLVYWANNQLYLRAMDQLDEAKPIPGTEGAREPFFSADGQWIGFFQGQLKKVSIRGGAVMRLAEAGNPYGASWEADDQVLFGAGPDGIWRVAGTGGTPEKVIAVKDGEEAHGPQQLPDGWILYTLRPQGTISWDDAQIVVESRTGVRTVLIRGGRDARYLRTGHLIYGLNGVLYAVPFDLSNHTVRSGAAPVAEGVMDADVRTGAMHYSVSADGSLVYVIGASGERGTLLFMDRQGRPSALPGGPMQYARPRISPDGTRVAVEIGDGDNRNLQIYDLARFILTPLTSNPLRAARFPLWTRDSRQVVFFSDLEGGGLFSKSADGTGTTTRLTTSAAEQLPYSWSAEGRTLLFEQRSPGTANSSGLFVLPLDGERTATPLLKTSAGESQPALSPDGRWLGYASSNPTPGVYVRPFPDVEKGRWLISDAGTSPLWSRDGRELFFIARGGQAMGVSIETEPTFRAGNPRVMFELGPYYQGSDGRDTRQWDIEPGGGGRFLLLNPGDWATTNDGAARPQLIIVRNWFEELKRLVPTK